MGLGRSSPVSDVGHHVEAVQLRGRDVPAKVAASLACTGVDFEHLTCAEPVPQPSGMEDGSMKYSPWRRGIRRTGVEDGAST